MRFAPASCSIFVLAPALICCSAANVPIPEGASESGRFLALDPKSLPPCGSAGVSPARGRLPALGPFSNDDLLLLELDSAFIASHYADQESAPVLRITERAFDDGFDAVALPAPIRAWKLDGDNFTDAEPPADLRLAMVTKDACAARIEDRCANSTNINAACAELEEIVDIFIPNAIDRGVGVVLPLDHQRALVSARALEGLRAERFYIADASRSQAILVRDVPDDLAHFAAFRRSPEESIWIAGPEGRLARAGSDLIFSEVNGVRHNPSTTVWIDGTRDPNAPFELYTFDDYGWFERFDGESWTVLNGPLPELFESPYGGVAWIGPGEAVAVGSRISDVLRYRGGTMHVETFTNGSDDRATAIAVIPGLGTIIGTSRGALYRDEGDGNWVQLESPLDNRPVHGISPFRTGFVFGRSLPTGSGGQISEWVPGHGLCDTVRVTDREVRALYPIEDGFVVYSKDVSTDPFVGFVREKNAYPECAGPAD